jgi:hypothetical protein
MVNQQSSRLYSVPPWQSVLQFDNSELSPDDAKFP